MLENDVVHFVHNDVMFAIKNVPLGTHHKRSDITAKQHHLPQANIIEITSLVSQVRLFHGGA